MAQSYEIPLISMPQKLNIELGGTIYILRLRYCFTPMGGWVMDIYDNSGTQLICGMPLVTGCDLLEQYAYVGIQGSMYVETDGNPPEVPTHDNLGTLSHLYYYI
jgi:hypothetical protein